MSKVLCWFCFEICITEGRKGRECIFENKAHRTFDIINTSTSVQSSLGTGLKLVSGYQMLSWLSGSDSQSLLMFLSLLLHWKEDTITGEHTKCRREGGGGSERRLSHLGQVEMRSPQSKSFCIQRVKCTTCCTNSRLSGPVAAFQKEKYLYVQYTVHNFRAFHIHLHICLLCGVIWPGMCMCYKMNGIFVVTDPGKISPLTMHEFV